MMPFICRSGDSRKAICWKSKPQQASRKVTRTRMTAGENAARDVRYRIEPKVGSTSVAGAFAARHFNIKVRIVGVAADRRQLSLCAVS